MQGSPQRDPTLLRDEAARAFPLFAAARLLDQTRVDY